jgi:endonuclease/exonuclease/phosphatase family metal-dependent hydrolase
MPQFLKLASFNLLNLAPAGFECYPNQGALSPEIFRAKSLWTARSMDQLWPDFIGFQEVWDEATLRDCVGLSEWGRKHGTSITLAAPHAVSGNKLPRVGFATRLPVLRQQSFSDLPTGLGITLPGGITHQQFSRPVLMVELDIGQRQSLVLMVVHLKSKRPEFLGGEDERDPRLLATAQLRSLMMRAAEAAGVRHLVLSELGELPADPNVPARENKAVGVVGDFNDALRSVTTQMIARTSYKRFDKPERGRMLFDAVDIQSERHPRHEKSYTHIHDGEAECIDHVLLSEEFWFASKHAIGEVTRVDYFNDHLALRISERANVYSDHGQVLVTVRMRRADKDASEL